MMIKRRRKKGVYSITIVILQCLLKRWTWVDIEIYIEEGSGGWVGVCVCFWSIVLALLDTYLEGLLIESIYSFLKKSMVFGLGLEVLL